MSSFKLSSTEAARFSKEEKARLRIQRLNEVRDREKLLAARRRNAVEEEKKRIQQHLLERFKHQWQSHNLEEIIRLEETLKCSLLEIGESHRNAEALNIDGLNEEKAVHETENRQEALKKYRNALNNLRDEKGKEANENSKSILARSYALDMEKSRAAMIASLPKPKQVQPLKTAVNNQEIKAKISRTTTIDVVVEKENFNTIQTNAADNAILCERNLETREEERERIMQEGKEKALQRHKEALERRQKQRNEENELRNINEIQKNNIARKKELYEIQSKQILANNLKQKERSEREVELRKKNEEKVCHPSLDILDVTAESDILDEGHEAGDITLVQSNEETGLQEDDDDRIPDSDSKSVVTGDAHSLDPKFQLSPDALRKLHEKIELQKNDWLKLQQSKTEKKDVILQTDDHNPVISRRVEERSTSTLDDNSLETSNSYVPQFHSIPDARMPPSGENFENSDNEDEADSFLERLEIEKKKTELLNFLRLIEERKKILEEQNSALCDSEVYEEGDIRNINTSIEMLGESPATVRTSLGSFTKLPPVRSVIQMTSPTSEESTTYLEMLQSTHQFNERSIIPSIVIPHFSESMESSEISSRELDKKASVLLTDYSTSSASSKFYNSDSTKYHSLPVNQNSLILENNITSTFDNSTQYNAVMVNGNVQSLAPPASRPVPVATNDSNIEYRQQGSNRNRRMHEEGACHWDEHCNVDSASGLGNHDNTRKFTARSTSLRNDQSTCCGNPHEASVLRGCCWETSSILSPDETVSSENSLCRSSLSSAALHERASWLYKSLEIPDEPTDLRFCDCTSTSIGAPYDDFINANINNNNDCSCSDVTSSEIRNPSFSEDSLVKNWAEILRPYQEKGDEVSKSLSLSEHSIESSTYSEELQLSDAGIIEEPDLTLVSCNTTLSSALNSTLPPEPFCNSGQMVDSLLSFEKHELSIGDENSSSLIPTIYEDPALARITECKETSDNNSKTLCAAAYTSSIAPTATRKTVEQSKPSTSKLSVVKKVPLIKPNIKSSLLYPDSKKLQADMKATLGIWKTSRSATFPSSDQATLEGSALNRGRLRDGRGTDFGSRTE